ncbi:MAG: class I SAM-dependent methyltransferase [candidate division WOR-3 bacterium]
MANENNYIYLWLKLIKLAKTRLRSPEDYFNFECFQGNLLVEYLRKNNIDLRNKIILDVGSGFGGYAYSLHNAGAKVFSLDLESFLHYKNIYHVIGNALNLPYKREFFDLIVCSSLVEHVKRPQLLIRELSRVLSIHGFLYISYPPFFSPLGGHHFSPFHLFGEKVAISLTKFLRKKYFNIEWIKEKGIVKNPNSISELFENWGLYPITIKDMKKIISMTDLYIIDMSTRWFPINTSKIPVINEYITWHVQFLMRKVQ